jgi:hypothetical protein
MQVACQAEINGLTSDLGILKQVVRNALVYLNQSPSKGGLLQNQQRLLISCCFRIIKLAASLGWDCYCRGEFHYIKEVVRKLQLSYQWNVLSNSKILSDVSVRDILKPHSMF